MKLDVKAFALALGILTAVFMAVFAWLTGLLNWGSDYINMVSTVYIGYAATLVGGIIGAIWGFVEGLIGGALLAWLYNKFVK